MSYISSAGGGDDYSVGPDTSSYGGAVPNIIMATGFPLPLIGWNGVYVRNTVSGRYSLEAHTLVLFGLFAIPILGVDIVYNQQRERWEFFRQGDYSWMFDNKRLLGNWGDFQVSENISRACLTRRRKISGSEC